MPSVLLISSSTRGPQKAALTAAHTGTAAALDTVNGGGGDLFVQSVQNFALGDRLTAADHAAIGGFLCNEPGFFFGRKLLEAHPVWPSL